ncbi:hypothetical protein [Streptomyces sp. NPDC051909]|uniref:hypothetical protein n=1 Tax=Streptomyces sp. NPDC051909 TaxID=3154944 RepID=UPI0034398C0F
MSGRPRRRQARPGPQQQVPFPIYRLWDLEAEGLDEDGAERYGTALQLRDWWAE